MSTKNELEDPVMSGEGAKIFKNLKERSLPLKRERPFQVFSRVFW